MTDATSTPTASLMTLDQARALIAAADAERSAAIQAEKAAAIAVVKDLVATDVFRQAHDALNEALKAAPKITELAHAAEMMDRMVQYYPAG